MKPTPVLLALETSGKSGSVAILREQNGVLACDIEWLSIESGSAKTLAPAIARLMAKNEIQMESLIAVALLTGPGSFTGLRVGVATAKAMAYALRIPTVEIDTLDVVAWQCPVVSSSVYAIIDAYRGQVFAAQYSIKTTGASPELEKISGTEILDIDVLLHRASKHDSRIQTIDFCGPGCDRIRRFLANPESGCPEIPVDVQCRIRWIDGSATVPSAATVARLGYSKFLNGEAIDPFVIQPKYYRGSAADEVAAKAKP